MHRGAQTDHSSNGQEQPLKPKLPKLPPAMKAYFVHRKRCQVEGCGTCLFLRLTLDEYAALYNN